MLTLVKEYTAFDAATSTLTVQVRQEYVPDNDPQATPEIVSTWPVSVRLPVNGSGEVTTNLNLIQALVEERVAQRVGPLVQAEVIVPAGGVTNAQVIYSLTSTVETDELAAGTLYVLLTPDPASETTPNVYTRSIMQLITSRTNLSRPFDVGLGQFVTLDNGNIVISQGLTDVESVGVVTAQAGPFAITAANDNTDTLAVIPWVYTTRPDYVDNMDPEAWQQGYDFYQVYIEHDAIEMQGQTTAIFNY